MDADTALNDFLKDHSQIEPARQPLQPGRHVDAVAVNIVAFHQDIANVDTNAILGTLGLRQFLVALGNRTLNIDRTVESRRAERSL